MPPSSYDLIAPKEFVGLVGVVGPEQQRQTRPTTAYGSPLAQTLVHPQLSFLPFVPSL